MEKNLQKAASLLLKSSHTVAFTGAGISVESGIPPFRGKDGLWSKYDPKVLELDYFFHEPDVAWPKIKEIFYDFFGEAKPNVAHTVLARMEREKLLECVVTQNIDNLHQAGGSKKVWEFHGNSQWLICPGCKKKLHVDDVDLSQLPPRCVADGEVLKPDFVFFGEGIPDAAYHHSFEQASQCEVMLIVGTTGEVMPASMIPFEASKRGATIIEINPEPSCYTDKITDLFIRGKAGVIFQALEKLLFN